MAVIEVEHLQKAYGTTVAVRDVTFSVAEGEIFGMLGPNGAGKTTTAECIIGLRVPDAGTIRVLGLDPLVDAVELRPLVGVQLQESALPPKLKVGEALSLYASFYREPDDPARLLEALGLAAKRDDYFKDLSGGQKQRLSIALALIGHPRIAVLDELTTGLDPQARRDTWRLVEGMRERGVTTLLVTHQMDEAERLCDRVALIDAGRIVALDTPQRLAEQRGRDKQVRFRPSATFDDRILTDLPEVGAVEHQGERVIVGGSGDLVNAVILSLAKAGVTAGDVQLGSGTLEDAFLALTGRGIREPNDAEPTAPPSRRRRRRRRRRRELTPAGKRSSPASHRRRAGHSAPRSAFRALVVTEWKLARRSPVGLVWGVGLPVLLLVIIGSLPALAKSSKGLGGLTFFDAYLPVLIALSLSLLALVALPIPLVSYRESGVLRRMQTTPVPPSWVLGAQVVVDLILWSVALLTILIVGYAAFGSHPPRQIPGFVVSLILAVAAMFALGLWIAANARTAKAAGAIGGALFYPLAFFAGLWFPVQLMAPAIRTISHLTPLGAAVEAMQSSIRGDFPSAGPLLVMATWAAVFGVAAVKLFSWE
jgi:ABC-2 type transport system ATP-binding protein